MKNLTSNWAKTTWIVGLLLFFVGEFSTAFNAKRDDTASEFWRDLPDPARYAVFGGMCAVLAHWVWGLPQKIAEQVVEEIYEI